MKDIRETLNEDFNDSVVPLNATHWADYMYELTPVEQKSDGMWYKREDKFAIHGINSINGSKCRQLLHLFETRPKDVDTVIHATNVNASPQTPMTAAMAEHYGLRCIQVAGGTSLDAINKHQLPLFATMFGTEYEIATGSGFNVNIQKRVSDIMETFPKSFTIERDITVDHKLEKNTPDVIKDFHDVGAFQTSNFPDHITDLIMPFGSANSATSVLLGLSRDLPKSLKRIHLVNVGVDKRKYMFERLEMMHADVSMYEFVWHESGEPYSKAIKGMSVDDITFHYRYEAKVYKYIIENHPELIKDTTLFWVIGSVPDLGTTAKNLKREVPTTVKTYIHKETYDIDVQQDLMFQFEDDKSDMMDEWGMTEEDDTVDESRTLDENVEGEPTLYYIKGGNGAGKSTIPVQLMKFDDSAYKISSNHYNKTIMTVFPKVKLISLGNYEKDKTFGGCDGLVKEEILYALHAIRETHKFDDYSIYLEGSMPSDTIANYFDMMKLLTDRKMVVLFLSTTYAQALDRIQARTGKTDEQMAALKNVESKYIRLGRAKIAYREQIAKDDLNIKLLELDTDGTIEEVFVRFLSKDLADITVGDVCHS